MSREEKSGFKAEIGLGESSSNRPSSLLDKKMSEASDKYKEEKKSPYLKHKKSSPDIDDNYEDEFEDPIDEDIQHEDPDQADNSNIIGQSKNFDSHAITVS